MMNALKLLQAMDYDKKRELFKRVPEYAIAKMNFEDRTANGLTKCIIHFLQLKGHWATRINTTGRLLQGREYTDVLGHRKQHVNTWIPGSTKRGTADIHSVINGRHVSIEVKVGKDRMSEAQRKTQKEIEQSGGLYFIARSFEDFYQAYIQLTT